MLARQAPHHWDNFIHFPFIWSFGSTADRPQDLTHSNIHSTIELLFQLNNFLKVAKGSKSLAETMKPEDESKYESLSP